LQESRQTVELYADKYLPIAEQSLRAAQVNYEAGKGSFLELLTAQRRLIEVRQMQQEALATFHRRNAALSRAVGEDF
jgi:outer membrane protein TolC